MALPSSGPRRTINSPGSYRRWGTAAFWAQRRWSGNRVALVTVRPYAAKYGTSTLGPSDRRGWPTRRVREPRAPALAHVIDDLPPAALHMLGSARRTHRDLLRAEIPWVPLQDPVPAGVGTDSPFITASSLATAASV
jgi:hypothetical protein